jgi:hypothetical protein
LWLLGCGDDGNAGGDGGDAGGSGGSTTASGNTASTTASGNSGGSAGEVSDSGEVTTTGDTGGTGGIVGVPGDPGCGLEAAAFCDTFEAPSANQGRAGDLDAKLWSASVGSPQLPSSNGLALPVGPATLPVCRDELPEQAFPDDQSLVCDPTTSIHSNHLLVAVGAQNYGQNSYRIRQPFDFTGRTGHIVLDAEGFMHSLIGFPSIAITEDPAPIPSYSIGTENQNNSEGGAAPRSALLIRFINCSSTDEFGVDFIDVLENYQDSLFKADPVVCVPAQQGALNHIEISVSQDRVEVYATPFSPDGLAFDAPQLLHAADVSLPFTRGYVQLTVHNHASIKYSEDRLGEYYDAWFSRFDNVGFDGPVLTGWKEFEAPSSLILGEGATSISGPVMSVGYRVADVADGPSETIPIENVELDGIKSASLAVASWYSTSGEVEQYNLRFRLNGGAWHDRPLTSGEVALLTGSHTHGALSQMLEVPVSDLKEGTNTVEFVSENIPQNFPPVVSGIDLVTTTE